MKISIYELVGSSLTAFVSFNLLMIMMKEKNIYKNISFWISTLALSLYVYISFLLTNNFMKVIVQFFVIGLLCKFSTKNKYNNVKYVMLIFFEYVAFLLIDIVMSVGLIQFLNIDNLSLNQHVILKFISNAVCLVLLVLFFNNKHINLLVSNICNYSFSVSKNYLLILILVSVSIFSIAIYFCLVNYNAILLLMLLFFMITIYTIIVIMVIKVSYQRSKIQAEYDILLTNLSEYENLLDKQRISNHENKNQLLVIKGMVDKNESNVSEYINSIIDTQYKDNDTLIIKTNRIPSGGLKGLIYYKMLTMKEKKINVNLEVDRSLRDLDFSTIPVKTHQELCKIVGVLLDNAIQALENSTNKEINIFLEYVDNEFIIKISNTYDGNIDLDKIDSAGYTTKGKGHGYGLSLVKNIIRNNKVFKNEREVNGKLFSQIIKLNIQ